MGILDSLRTQASQSIKEDDLSEIENELSILEQAEATSDAESREDDALVTQAAVEQEHGQLADALVEDVPAQSKIPESTTELDLSSTAQLEQAIAVQQNAIHAIMEHRDEEDASDEEALEIEEKSDEVQTLDSKRDEPTMAETAKPVHPKIYVTGTRKFSPQLNSPIDPSAAVDAKPSPVRITEEKVELDQRLLTTSYKSSLITAFIDMNPSVYPNSSRQALTVDLGEKGKVFDSYESFVAENMDQETAVECVVRMVQMKGWDSIHVSGDEQYIEAITNACHKIGVEVIPESPSLEKAMINKRSAENKNSNQLQAENENASQQQAEMKKQNDSDNVVPMPINAPSISPPNSQF